MGLPKQMALTSNLQHASSGRKRTYEEHGGGQITTVVAQNAVARMAVLTAAVVGLDPTASIVRK